VRALHLRLPVNTGSPGEARRQLRRWLTCRGWPERETGDLLLAVSEAVSNSVEHAYPAPNGEHQRVELRVTDQPGPDHTHQAVVMVTDQGCWLPPPADPGDRGRGLQLMRLLTDSLAMSTGAAGTTVRMVSHVVQLTRRGVNDVVRRLGNIGPVLVLARLATGH
jgi:serine/threonine-protein kinase RsbW